MEKYPLIISFDSDGTRESYPFSHIDDNQFDQLKDLLTKDHTNLNVIDSHGYIPLVHAAFQNRLDMVRELLQYSQHYDINSVSKTGNSALHFAVHHKNVEMVRLLCDHHIDRTIRNKKNKTALENARYRNCTEIVTILQ